MAATLVAATSASAAWADGFSGGATLANDKLYRGISQSQGRASLLLDLAWRTDTGWHLGAGLATLAPGAEASVEAGRSWQLDTDWTGQLDAAYATYSGTNQRRLYDYAEIVGRAGWRGRLYAAIAVAPRTRAYDPGRGELRSGVATTYEVNAQWPLREALALDAGIGYADLSHVVGAGYAYGSLGLAGRLGPWQWTLGHVQSQAGRRGIVPVALAGNRWLAAVVWSF